MSLRPYSSAAHSNQETKPVIVTVAGNLVESRSLSATSEPDLVITDYLLPDGTGIELLAENQASHRFPMIMMSNYGDNQISEKAIHAGAMDFISKSNESIHNIARICTRVLRDWSHIKMRQRADTALEISEKKFEHIFNYSNDAIYLIDPERDEILEANARASQILGFTHEELLSKRISDLHPNEMPEFRTFTQSIFENGKGRQINSPAKRRTTRLFRWKFLPRSLSFKEGWVSLH